MFSGKLRHRITIQKPVFTQDQETGAPSPITWQDVYVDLAAEVRPPSARTYGAREMIAANQIQSRIVADVTIRFKNDLTPDMRILHRSTIYNIAGLLPDNNSGLEYLTIPCSSGLNTG